MKYNRKYKTITITVSISEMNVDGSHEIDKLTTNLINKTTKTINKTIKSHNRFKKHKIDNDGISINTFPNNI